MKKLVPLLLVCVMMLSAGLGLVGCSRTGWIDFVMPEEGYDGKKVTIEFYNTMGDNLQVVLDEYIVEFNKLFPNIEIKTSQPGGYDDVRDQIRTELTAGKQPNIAYCYPDHVALYNLAKAVVTLDDLIESQIQVEHEDGTTEIMGLTQAQKNDFIEGYYDEGKQFGDGLMYTMPFSRSTEVLYYNKTFFEKNNLTVPTTWEQMEATCRAIKAIDPTSIPLGYDSEANWFITMCEQLGTDYTSATGDYFLFNNDENKEFVKELRQWRQDKLLTTQEIHGNYTSSLFIAQTGNKSYMSIGSSAGATHQRPTKVGGKYPFDVGIAPIPQADASNPKAISQGPSVCIFKSNDPQEVVASWLFVKFLTTNVAFQAKFSMASGYIPVIKSVASNPVYAEFIANANGGDNIAALSAQVCLAQADSYYTSPAFIGSSHARDQVGILLQKCLDGEVEPNQTEDVLIALAFSRAVSECERLTGSKGKYDNPPQE